MIESVQVRQRGSYDFETHYDNLCALQNSCPLPAVKAHLSQGILDVNGDRVRATDWVPILNTLKINKTLEYVSVKSSYQAPTDEEKNTIIQRKKIPAIRSKEITYRLCRALKDSLGVSPTLTRIDLHGLPLREKDILTLSKGISKNTTLNHLSLDGCRISDTGIETVCRGLRHAATVNSVNFSSCAITWKGADSLARVIKGFVSERVNTSKEKTAIQLLNILKLIWLEPVAKYWPREDYFSKFTTGMTGSIIEPVIPVHQAMRRHNEAWRDSLRYRRPDLDRMPGIRRITINSNPMLSDQGAVILAEALKDDLWLKALDMQSCGISTSGARSLLDVLKYNTTLVVLDIRSNPLIDRDVLHSIMEQLMLNCNGQDTEYKWIKTEELTTDKKRQMSPRKGRTITVNGSFGRRAGVRGGPGAHRRTKSAGAAGVSRPLRPGRGVPWRAAARANRLRGYPPDRSLSQSLTSLDSQSQSASSLNTPLKNASLVITNDVSDDGQADDDEDDDGDDEDEDEKEDDESMDVVEKGIKIIKDRRIETSLLSGADARSIRHYKAKRQLFLKVQHWNALSQAYQCKPGNKVPVKDLIRHQPIKCRAQWCRFLTFCQVEVEQLKRRLQEESDVRAQGDRKIMELTVENQRLKNDLEEQRLKISSSTGGNGLLDDDQLLESIETSFKQFHNFLDLLRDAGLGQLISMAGIDQNSMPFSPIIPEQLLGQHANQGQMMTPDFRSTYMNQPGSRPQLNNLHSTFLDHSVSASNLQASFLDETFSRLTGRSRTTGQNIGRDGVISTQSAGTYSTGITAPRLTADATPSQKTNGRRSQLVEKFGRQKPQEQTVRPHVAPKPERIYAGDIHSAGQVSQSYGSYEEEVPIIIDPFSRSSVPPEPAARIDSGASGDPTMKCPEVDTEYHKMLAKRHTDELYDKLVEDTRGILNLEDPAQRTSNVNWFESDVRKDVSKALDFDNAGKLKKTDDGDKIIDKKNVLEKQQDIESDTEEIVKVNDVEKFLDLPEKLSDKPRNVILGKDEEKFIKERPDAETLEEGDISVDVNDHDHDHDEQELRPLTTTPTKSSEIPEQLAMTPDALRSSRSSHQSEASYTMESFEQSYVSGRGEVIHDLDELEFLADSPI